MTDLLRHDLVTQLACDKEIEALKEENRQLSSRLNEASNTLRRERAEWEKEVTRLGRVLHQSRTSPIMWDTNMSYEMTRERCVTHGTTKRVTCRYNLLPDMFRPEARDEAERYIKEDLIQCMARKIAETVNPVVVYDTRTRITTYIVDFYLMAADIPARTL